MATTAVSSLQPQHNVEQQRLEKGEKSANNTSEWKESVRTFIFSSANVPHYAATLLSLPVQSAPEG